VHIGSVCALKEAKAHRKARLIEIDPIYCDQTVRRGQKLTGRLAVNAAGVPFNDFEKP